ncbi:Protein-methionine-sulfoxide reductase catalytic subunit MsrP [Candidatus Lokiarchaeum ossiferum]|uniref:Protein-methionine-sulfoxide reductase catalytic subunit MsrP n=1 Tax=Candidatus Lokiarchaeum ossiferum TaxID=2951803 RepID=A0ABY6HTI0_9ARCH|nr:Protein-methionine-sulfoxide reductase catalytic subunit MsrP [Candidatus Lokiarchaeum sp. B-35]
MGKVSDQRKGIQLFLGLILIASIPLISVMIIAYRPEKITSNENFFTNTIKGDPGVDIANYSLIINGEIENQLNYSYDEFKALPNTTFIATLQCVEGPSSTAEFTGVLVSDLLDLAIINATAHDVIFYGLDGYSSSLTIEEVYNSTILLAYEMNGAPLPPETGYPLGIVAPGHLGYKWVQWVYEIKVTTEDYHGYWESRGWADDAQYDIVSGWEMHAILFSIAFFFGVLAQSTGLKFTARESRMKELPKFVNSQFHLVVSITYILSIIGILVYWSVVTYNRRGNLFYTLHGWTALLSVLFHIIGGILGRQRSMNRKKNREKHFNFHLVGFLLFCFTIFLGILRTTNYGVSFGSYFNFS